MFRLLPAIMTATLALPLAAQHAHGPATPGEPGQGAFAAIAEIVGILRDDPATDWQSVDIAGLRRHLVDMDLLATRADVTAIDLPGGARFEARGEARTRDAVRAMVADHAPFLAAATGWTVTVEEIDEGVAMNVTGKTEQIRALGFFGVMTIDAHHQQHHVAMARGGTPHHR